MRRSRGWLLVVLLTSMVAVACEGGPPEATPRAAPAMPERPAVEGSTVDASVEDPFAYCGQVVDADAPGAPYSGDPHPSEVFLVLADEMGLPPEAPVRSEVPEFNWRCMDGFVYACTWGANLPCGPADLRSRATPEMIEFCASHPDGTPLPGSLTGHQTIYGWICRGETPATTHRKYEVDSRGFVASFWHWIPEPEAGSSAAAPSTGSEDSGPAPMPTAGE